MTWGGGVAVQETQVQSPIGQMELVVQQFTFQLLLDRSLQSIHLPHWDF